jgi:DNA-binding NtrC family response regulator
MRKGLSRNAIKRAVVLGRTDSILREDLPEAVLEAGPILDAPGTNYCESVKEAKKQIVLKAVERAEGDYMMAAKLLGMHPNNLHRLIRTLDLKAALKK